MGPPSTSEATTDLQFIAKAVRSWLAELGVVTLFIEPGSPWENGYIESLERQAAR